MAEGFSLKYGKREFIYLHIQEAEHFVVSFGIDFYSFMRAVNEPPQNLLLMDHPFMDVEYDMHTQFNYISFPAYKKYFKENGKEYNQLIWMDFEDIDGLEELAPWELAEILYVRHSFNHLRPPFYNKMNNRYVYLSLEDGYYNKIYYRYWKDFYQLVGNLIPDSMELNRIERNWLGTKKRIEYPSVPPSLVKQLTPMFNEGAIISVDKIIQNRANIEIPIWAVGDYRDEDDLKDDLKTIYQSRQNAKLVYQKKAKEWILTD